ncbi:GNAT family N-acetyltransferase [Actinopolymorpha sp. B11F2]|uniref:GNAT family N-acetyltransferase n=1 Tax=Actinopolymorpha sp. B11F2 TaxID=3160862 RepID=UPI0032E4CF7B
MRPRVPTARELAGYFLTAQHPLTRLWVDDGVRMELLTAQRVDDVALATDLEFAAQRARRFAPAQPPETLLNRWVSAGEDLFAMASMRYEGGDPTRPFVDATVTSRPGRADDLPALARACAQPFAPLRPRYLRLWSAEPADYFPGTARDRRSVAAPVRDLRVGTGRVVPDELALTPASSLAYYDEARVAYDDVDSEHHAHAHQAVLSDRDDLEEYFAAGTLFDVTVGGEWAGYVAVSTEGETLGMPAYVVKELVLATRFRGRGYGAHLATLLARAVPDETRVLIGRIHADNRGARQAAERAGRVDVGGWLQVPYLFHDHEGKAAYTPQEPS